MEIKSRDALEDDKALRVHNGYKGGTLAIENFKYLNRMDESFRFLCYTISPNILYHIKDKNTPNEV